MPRSAPLFDTYLMVDWSAANAPKRGRDSIWLCQLERRRAGALGVAAHENPATRHEAHARLRAILVAALAERRSVLVGCDFPFGYVAGLAARLGLPSPGWRAIWDTIAALLRDDERNVSNRFTVAAELNRRISGAAFPFWGCPARQAGPCLAMRHHRLHEAEGLNERRLSDHRLRRLQPGWKLAGTGSAGSQALTGIPVVRRLRDDPDLAASARVWPFETGLRTPGPHDGRGRILFAEVYPSQIPPVAEPGEVKDAAQVRTIARHFAMLDAAGALAAVFEGDPALSSAERALVEREEGWVLGIIGGPETRQEGRSSIRKRTSSFPPPLAGEGGVGDLATATGSSNIAANPRLPHLDPPPQAGEETA